MTADELDALSNLLRRLVEMDQETGDIDMVEVKVRLASGEYVMLGYDEAGDFGLVAIDLES